MNVCMCVYVCVYMNELSECGVLVMRWQPHPKLFALPQYSSDYGSKLLSSARLVVLLSSIPTGYPTTSNNKNKKYSSDINEISDVRAQTIPTTVRFLPLTAIYLISQRAL